MRLDRLQHYLNNRGLARAISHHLGYRHLDWISKDTDMQAAHWPRYFVVWDVPEDDYDFDAWSIGIADILREEAPFTSYHPTLDDDQGVFMLYGYRIQANPDTDSGWSLVFEYTYIDPKLALM